jgi:integrase
MYEQKLLNEITLRGLSQATVRSYLHSIKMFTRFCDKPCTELDVDDAKRFIVYLRDVKKVSARTTNAKRAGITFYLRHVLGRRIDQGSLPSMKTPSTIPVVLTKEEVELMINSLHNVFYKTVIIGLYSTGLRSEEFRNLKVEDIDSKAMVIHVRNGKGAKDRKALLSPVFLKYLRLYWQKYRLGETPKCDYLFTSTKPSKRSKREDGRLSHTALGYIVDTAVKASGIKKKFTLIPSVTRLQLTY